MNKYQDVTRKRNQSLLVVEGRHEKHRLFWLILQCFPEINMNMDEVWIYGTNIYQLYDDIVREYGGRWASENEAIDLPFVISKKQFPNRLRYQVDFTNIILVFDYERHDANFSEKKILEMQSFFRDAADMGKLYLNYPMIESYQHLCALPDPCYEYRKIPVSLQPGRMYKALVERDSALGLLVDFPHRIDELLEKRFYIADGKQRESCRNEILECSVLDELDEMIHNALRKVMQGRELMTAKYQLMDWVKKRSYISTGHTYWKYMRMVLQQIIHHNICKANRILYDQYEIPEQKIREYFERLDMEGILRAQNLVSRDEGSGFIWVLNTCVFFVAEYNFSLLNEG